MSERLERLGSVADTLADTYASDEHKRDLIDGTEDADLRDLLALVAIGATA